MDHHAEEDKAKGRLERVAERITDIRKSYMWIV